MNDFLFQCVSKKTMNVAISQNEEFNNRLKKHLLDMNDIEIEYRDNAPIFSLTPFVQVNIHQNCDSYYVVVIPDFQFNQFERFVPTLKGIFFDYNEETGYIVFYNSKNNEILLNEPLKNVLSLDKNILKIKKKDFSNFVLIMQSALQGKKKRLDISFKSSIEKKDVTYILESSYKNQSHTLGYFRNIDSYAKEIEKLTNIANKDALTGVYAKQIIKNRIKELLEAASLNDKYIIGIIDIDYFKNINDTYGHLFGDEILIAFTKNLSKAIGKAGMVGRIGGDEFLFVYPVKSTVEEDIKPICRKIKHIIRQITFQDKSQFTLTSTMGISCYPKDGLNYDDLFVTADKALYRGKLKGRDCYIIYNEANHSSIKKDNYLTFAGLPERKNSDSSLVSECLDGLLNTNDLEEEINNVIKKTVNHFRIDRITISDSNLNILFQYSRDNQLLDHGYELFNDESYRALFKTDNMLQITDIVQLRTNNPQVTEYYTNKHIKSLVQIILYNNGIISGYISFDMYLERRVWMPEELMYFNIISKIISGFFYKFQIERKLKDVSNDDALTCLLSPVHFKQLVLEKIKEDLTGALIAFDIVKFRLINEYKGYDFGSSILKEIAKKITSVSKSDYVCRLHDDVFVLYSKFINKDTMHKKFELVKHIVDSVGTHYNITIGLAQGAVIFNVNDGLDYQALIDRALEAKKFSKDNGIIRLIIYDDKVHEQTIINQTIEAKMENALKNKEFEVYLQPCYELKTNTISSFEALVRWNTNDGIMSPDHFIPLFEKNGFIVKMDFYVYEVVCQTLARWKNDGHPLRRISVNVSRCHINDKDFVIKLNALLNKYNIDKKYFGIEITESLFMENENDVISLVEILSKEGYQIYMDDFGVAYSTLNLLSRVHVDVIKLDRGFIRNDFRNNRETIVIRNIIQMARELGINVLSEGIETQKQALELKDLNCDYAQGFYYQKPMPISEIEKLYLKK